MMLWCATCEYGWNVSAGRNCWGCGAEGDARHHLVRACLASTGLDAEGREYKKAHPEWTP